MGRALSLLALVLAPTLASAAEGPWRVGGDLALLFRDEAGGNRTVLPSVWPRVSFGFAPHLRAAASYGYAYAASSSAVAGASTQHHRLLAGVDCALPVRAASFVGGAGLAAVLMHTTLLDHGAAVVSSTTVRPALWLSLGLEVPLAPVTLRFGVSFVAELARRDVVASIGATMPLGGAP